VWNSYKGIQLNLGIHQMLSVLLYSRMSVSIIVMSYFILHYVYSDDEVSMLTVSKTINAQVFKHFPFLPPLQLLLPD